MRAAQAFPGAKNQDKNSPLQWPQENCEDFLISDCIFRKLEENFSAQTCDHFKDEAYRLLNFAQNSITAT